MAYDLLAGSYHNQSDIDRAAENMRKAYGLRERVSEREKLSIASHYVLATTGNLEAGRKLCELWAQTYPRDENAHITLATVYSQLGDGDKAVTASREALKLNPSGHTYGNVGCGYLALNRLDEVKAIVQEARARSLAGPDLPLFFTRFISYKMTQRGWSGRRRH